MTDDEWRPIETAPKDGTVILLCDNGTATVAGWFDENHSDYPWRFIDDTRDFLCKHGYVIKPNGMPPFGPTHWRPLPAPPQVTE